MPELIQSDSELKAYLLLIERIEQKGERSSRYLEILNSIVSMDFKKENFKQFLENKDYLNDKNKDKATFLAHLLEILSFEKINFTCQYFLGPKML